MLHNAMLFLIVLFLSSGCVERGYKITSHNKTQTVSAELSTIVNDNKADTENDSKKINAQVINALKQQHNVRKNTQIEKKNLKNKTQELQFTQLEKVYYKFGTSEIHGHLIYLNANGKKVSLSDTKVYLLPVTKTLDHWYENYYLDNKTNDSYNKTSVEYLNSTYVNLEKNFSFHGLAEGEFYIIIESTNRKNKEKVYIAKKISVDKYKKLMAVFSRQLENN